MNADWSLLRGVTTLGMSCLVVHLHDGAQVDEAGVARAVEYRQRLGVSVHGWGRCDGEDGASPRRVADLIIDACRAARVSAYSANIEDRWENDPDAWWTVVTAARAAALPVSVCTYPGVGGEGHHAARAAGAAALLVQSFLTGSPSAYTPEECESFGRRLGWETVIPMLGVFMSSTGARPDAEAQRAAWGSRPLHCYPVEQALDGSYNWVSLLS